MRSILPITLLLLFCLACASSIDLSPTVPLPSPTLTGAAGTEAGVTIELWEQEDERARTTVLYPLIDEFRQSNPGVTVKATHYASEELRSQLQGMSDVDKMPDILRVPGDFVALLDRRTLLDMAALLGQDQLATFIPGALSEVQFDGAVWAVPDYLSGHLVLLYNKQLLSSPPATTDELIRVARDHTRQDEGMWGLVFNAQETLWMIPWLQGFGVRVDAGEQADVARIAQALAFVHDLAMREAVMPANCDYRTAHELFVRGRAAMVIDGEWAVSGYVQEGVSVGVAPLPKVSSTGLWPTPDVDGRYFVARQCDDPAKREVMRRLIQFLTGARAQQMWLERLGRLPSSVEVAQSERVQRDPVLAGLVTQLERVRGIPAMPRQQCLQDAIYGPLQELWAGRAVPDTAAGAIGREAERCYAE